MNLTFATSEGTFNYRACAVIVHQNRLLAMRDERSPYYYLPGGRVFLHETAEAAVLRELREELAIDAVIERPLWLCQSFFTEEVSDERYHELCLYYLIDVSQTDLLSRGERFTMWENRHQHTFEWLPFDQVKTAYLYPLFIKERITHLPRELEIIVADENAQTASEGETN